MALRKIWELCYLQDNEYYEAVINPDGIPPESVSACDAFAHGGMITTFPTTMWGKMHLRHHCITLCIHYQPFHKSRKLFYICGYG